MRYWDSSALIPFLLEEPRSEEVERLLKSDPAVVSWWGTPVECFSGLCRLKRGGLFTESGFQEARKDFDELMGEIDLIPPSKVLRERAIRLLSLHPLRAGDALQLAAAIHVVQEQTHGVVFISFDVRLRTAAMAERFTVLP